MQNVQTHVLELYYVVFQLELIYQNFNSFINEIHILITNQHVVQQIPNVLSNNFAIIATTLMQYLLVFTHLLM